MRLVHFSDTHLGFRTHDKITARGINQREADVARAFTNAITHTIELAPDLVVIAGDVFHHVKPANAAVIHALAGFSRLRAALPDVEVVVVAGNHDTPNVASERTILPAFAHVGVHVVDGPPQVLDFPRLDCSVLAIAENHHARPEHLEPNPDRRFNVMLLHGETGGMSGAWKAADEIDVDSLNAEKWDYIALGHYHVYREIKPNCFYSGAIEYTSSDSWGERREEIEKGIPGKGIVERDLATGAHTFHPLPITRHLADLPSIDAKNMTASEIDAAIAERVASIGGVDDKVVRLVVANIPPDVKPLLDYQLQRSLRKRALFFGLKTVAPAVQSGAEPTLIQRLKREPLDALVRRKLDERTLTSDVDRGALQSLAEKYLSEAAEKISSSFAATVEASLTVEQPA